MCGTSESPPVLPAWEEDKLEAGAGGISASGMLSVLVFWGCTALFLSLQFVRLRTCSEPSRMPHHRRVHPRVCIHFSSFRRKSWMRTSWAQPHCMMTVTSPNL